MGKEITVTVVPVDKNEVISLPKFGISPRLYMHRQTGRHRDTHMHASNTLYCSQSCKCWKSLGVSQMYVGNPANITFSCPLKFDSYNLIHLT